MTVVVDSNILIALVLSDDPLHIYAKKIVSDWEMRGESLVAPRLFRAEVTAVIRKASYQNRITTQQGEVLLRKALAFRVKCYDDSALLRQAYQLAVQLNLPRAYDTQYLALAERFGCEFWTVDERLVNSVRGKLNRVHWLGEII